MTTAAIASQGAAFFLGDAAGTTFAAVADIVSISGPSMARETIDVTTLDSAGAGREFIASFIDGGEVTLELNWLPEHATHDESTGFLALMLSGELRICRLGIPPANTAGLQFTCLVTGFAPNVPGGDKVGATVTLKVSGAPAWADPFTP